MLRQITVKTLPRPLVLESRPEEEVNWMFDSFGFISGRDLEQMSSKIMLEFLRQFRSERRVSSEDIAEHLRISSHRVNHHVRNLVDSGLLYRDRRLIVLRGGSMKRAVEEMRKDANRIFDELAVVAEDVDQKLGLLQR